MLDKWMVVTSKYKENKGPKEEIEVYKVYAICPIAPLDKDVKTRKIGFFHCFRLLSLLWNQEGGVHGFQVSICFTVVILTPV